MQSLLVRIFLSFWLIIAITIGTAALGGYWYAERIRDQIASFDLGDTMLAASAALESTGKHGLTEWLRAHSESSAVRLYVLDDDRRDLLGRRVPPNVMRTLERQRRFNPNRTAHEPPNLRRARALPQLVETNGSTYTFVVSRFRGRPILMSADSARTFMLALAILVSAIVSFFLARAITRPVTRLREATVALANGELNTRVAESLGGRRDELGMLATDFDRMADQLQKSAMQQTELSRNISHELRSPLARLRVALELARRQSGDSREFDRIDAEAERLDRLIGQILSYTRLDAAASNAIETLNLRDLVEEVVENVNYEARAGGRAGIKVKARLDASPYILGQRFAISSAVENVLRNALRHSPADCDIALTLAEDDGHARITIRDRGPGVADHELPKLFEPFFRTAESAADRSNGGTGLGLAIARRAVQASGGEISAGNADGGGLLITIVLPSAD